MTYKAYIDNIKTQTGRSPDDFLAMATKKGLIKDGKVVAKHAELLTWQVRHRAWTRTRQRNHTVPPEPRTCKEEGS